MDYPYQQYFRRFLDQQELSPLTIKTYDTSLTNLFNYLRANRPLLAQQPTLNNLTETDVRAYLNYLRDDKQITMTTYNKILSQLNCYFRYLFTHQLISAFVASCWTISLPGSGYSTRPTSSSSSGSTPRIPG